MDSKDRRRNLPSHERPHLTIGWYSFSIMSWFPIVENGFLKSLHSIPGHDFIKSFIFIQFHLSKSFQSFRNQSIFIFPLIIIKKCFNTNFLVFSQSVHFRPTTICRYQLILILFPFFIRGKGAVTIIRPTLGTIRICIDASL